MEKLKENIISLIVPCYNGEQVLHRCLDSILSQTYKKNIELILVNDGSTDRSEEVISSYKEKLKTQLYDFKYVYQENKGVGGAVNTALKYFTGEFLALLDIDDYMMPNSIEIRSEWLKNHPKYSIVLNTGYYVTEEDYFISDKLFESYENFCETEIFNDLLDGKLLNWPGTYMIRSKVWIKRCPTREIYPSRYGQNMQMILPAVYHEKGGYIDKPLMRYLVQEKSLSHFSNDGDGEKTFKSIYGYQDIYENIIQKICNESDKKILLNKIRISSAKTRLEIALKYRNKEYSKIAMRELKELDGDTLNNNIEYNYLNNKFKYMALRIIRKVKSNFKC